MIRRRCAADAGARGGLAGPPPDEPEADQGRGEAVDGVEDVGPSLVADREPSEAGEPSQGPFDDPAVPAQALGAIDPAPRNPRDDAPSPGRLAAVLEVVPFVRVQLGRPLAGPTGALPDRQQGVEQRLEERGVLRVQSVRLAGA